MLPFSAIAMALTLFCAVSCAPSPSLLIGEIELLPNDESPFTVRVKVSTTVPTRLTMVIRDEFLARRLESTGFHTDHTRLIAGLAVGIPAELTFVFSSEDGATEVVERSYWAPESGIALPGFSVDADTGAAPCLRSFGLGGYVVSVDQGGTIRSVLPSPSNVIYAVGATPEGLLYVLNGRTHLTLFDQAGAKVLDYCAAGAPTRPRCDAPLDAIALHHDAIRIPNGNWLALALELRKIEDFPVSESDPSAGTRTAQVAGDLIVEFNQEAGIVRTWSLLDYLDPNRIGRDSVSSRFWTNWFGEEALDWSHANALGFDVINDEVLVSLRHQDALVALHADGSGVSWILAPRANWKSSFTELLLTPEGDERVPYHLHGAAPTARNTILTFDNAAPGASAFEDLPNAESLESRALELKVDRVGRTWSTIHSFGTVPPSLAPSAGGIQSLDNGAALVTFGNVARPTDIGARLTEVRLGEPPTVSWDLRTDPGATVFRGACIQGWIDGF